MAGFLVDGYWWSLVVSLALDLGGMFVWSGRGPKSGADLDLGSPALGHDNEEHTLNGRWPG